MFCKQKKVFSAAAVTQNCFRMTQLKQCFHGDNEARQNESVGAAHSTVHLPVFRMISAYNFENFELDFGILQVKIEINTTCPYKRALLWDGPKIFAAFSTAYIAEKRNAAILYTQRNCNNFPLI